MQLNSTQIWLFLLELEKQESIILLEML
jgi:hypothetical protein